MMSIIFISIAATMALLLAGYLIAVQRIKVIHEAMRQNIQEQQISLHNYQTNNELLQSKIKDLESRLFNFETREKQTWNVLSPIIEKERLEHEFSALDSIGDSRTQLSKLLELISSKGNLNALMLVDEVGLPLGSTSEAENFELLGASSALLLNMVDKMTATGFLGIRAAVFRDESNRLMLYRIFRVAEERYVLTAIAHGQALSTETLEPALGKIERLLSSQVG